MLATGEVESMAFAAREALQRAYLYLGFGQYPEAIEACARAAELAPEHALPHTLKGSFEMAAGRMGEALATLRQATQRHPDDVLAQLYFAEACFLAGRHRPGQRALARAQGMAMDEALRALCAELEAFWAQMPPEVMPPALIAQVDAG